MNQKRGQAQVITTVLIILLVLAAIVIVWQVVRNTTTGAAEEVERQSACLGVSVEMSEVSAGKYSVKRIGGGTLDGASVSVISDGESINVTQDCGWSVGNPDWSKETTSGVCDLSEGTLPTSVIEASFVLKDGTVCGISGKVDNPTQLPSAS